MTIPADHFARREAYLEKPLPSDHDAEKVLLGAPLLIGKGALATVAERVSEDDFYSPLHRRVYAAMLVLLNSDTNLDPITIGNEMKKEGSLEAMGGITEITNLTYGLPHFNDSDLEPYIKIVLDKSKARKLVRICAQITGEVLAEEDEISDVVERAEQAIFSLSHEEHKTTAENVLTLGHELLTTKAAQIREGVHVTGLTTGLTDLDAKIGGYQRGDLYLIAGRPSMGKTAFTTKTLTDAVRSVPGGGVGIFFSAEMTKQAITARILCQTADMNLWRFNHNHIMDGEWSRLSEGLVPFQGFHFYIDDTPNISNMQILARSRRIAAKHGGQLDLVAVDHVGLMGAVNPKDSPTNQLRQISRDLKSTAKTLNTPVIALSQLSRDVEKRNPPRPMNSDLRDSGTLEQDADVILFMYRPEYYTKDKNDAGYGEIIIGKQRNGPTETVNVAWLKEFARFDNLLTDKDTLPM